MKKLRELLGLRRLDGSIGIEVEAEGENLNPIDSPTWKTEDDGSLRGAYPHQRSEYVLKKPVSIRSLSKVVQELADHQKDAELKFSYRCSVHVHINVGELTHSEFLAFLYMSLLLEEPLMNFCGEARKGNRFCLRIADAEGYMDELLPLFKQGYRAINGLVANQIRYSAINTASVPKYGSLEFRGMRGTLDVELITTWAQTLYRLREVAKKLGSPTAVHDMFISMDNISFAKHCFGKNFDMFNVPDVVREMDRSFSLSIDLPNQYREVEEVLYKPGKLFFANVMEEDRLDDLVAEAVRRVRERNPPPEYNPPRAPRYDHAIMDEINEDNDIDPDEPVRDEF